MKIRYARPEDDAAIREMHERMGLDYELPDLQKMASKLVFEDEQGKIRMAVYLRPTLEAYMFIDGAEKFQNKAEQAKEQWSRFVCLEKASQQNAIKLGFEDVYAFLPPQLERSFGRKLRRLKWFRPWAAFNKIFGEKS